MKKVIFCLFLVFIFLFSLLFFSSYNIKNNFNNYVFVNKDTNLYKIDNNKFINIGKINKNSQLILSEIKGKYYKIKNTKYYIFYKDVMKDNKILEFDNNKYLYFNYIINDKNITLINDKSKILIKDKIKLNIIKEDNYYHVVFNNQIYKVLKDFKKEKITIKEKKLKKLNILKFNNIDSKYLKYLKDNSYNFINFEDLDNFLHNKIILPYKSVLILLDKKKDDIKVSHEIYFEFIKRFKENNNYILYDMKDINYQMFLDIMKDKEIFKGKKAKEIPVLNYHFFYNPLLGEKCNETICLDINKFEEHLKYLKDNNYKILSINEYVNWIYKKIELPEKSILITIDDGAMGTSKINGNKLIPILEKYKVNATLFLITAWWDLKDYKSDYLQVESHGFNIHRYANCNNKKPLAICMSDQELKDDLLKSIDILKTSYAFCYPFYISDLRYRNIVKDVGFKIAFVGGDRKSTREDNKYKLPRYPIQYDITMKDFINILN